MVSPGVELCSVDGKGAPRVCRVAVEGHALLKTVVAEYTEGECMVFTQISNPNMNIISLFNTGRGNSLGVSGTQL